MLGKNRVLNKDEEILLSIIDGFRKEFLSCEDLEVVDKF